MKATVGPQSFPAMLVATVLVPAVLAAATCFAAAVLGFGAVVDGYSQLADPVAVLGALGMPHATTFNVLAFVLPGLLLAGVAMILYLRLPIAAGAWARIGAWVLLFSTLAFAAQGLFPLDLEDLDAITSRLHVAAWSLWWLTTSAGVVLLASGLWRLQAWRKWVVVVLAVLAMVPFFALLAPVASGSAMPQRIAYGVWFCGWWLMARGFNRNAVSSPGSSPPGRG